MPFDPARLDPAVSISRPSISKRPSPSTMAISISTHMFVNDPRPHAGFLAGLAHVADEHGPSTVGPCLQIPVRDPFDGYVLTKDGIIPPREMMDVFALATVIDGQSFRITHAHVRPSMLDGLHGRKLPPYM